jgi:hypothetical protein
VADHAAAADRVAEEGDSPKNQTREDMVAAAEDLELSWPAVGLDADDERHSGPALVGAFAVTRPFSGCTHRPRQLPRLPLASCHAETWAAAASSLAVVAAPWAWWLRTPCVHCCRPQPILDERCLS